MKTLRGNRSVCRLLTIGGVSRRVSEWAQIAGVSVGCINKRLRTGCSHQRAVFGDKPVPQPKPVVCVPVWRPTWGGYRQVPLEMIPYLAVA